ncbi:hypothetical protein GOP47_0006517 [Adiantum capillus-veneris]|uniref:Uncharacterized protein n=1 Tax=Adiantum capillus-veneris TaxID=13818 RepID=A0A9D4V3R8_ADICA|nr:hypothetical protein GOP47_0006517 [Adiantum capillus-veneris]
MDVNHVFIQSGKHVRGFMFSITTSCIIINKAISTNSTTSLDAVTIGTSSSNVAATGSLVVLACSCDSL